MPAPFFLIHNPNHRHLFLSRQLANKLRTELWQKATLTPDLYTFRAKLDDILPSLPEAGSEDDCAGEDCFAALASDVAISINSQFAKVLRLFITSPNRRRGDDEELLDELVEKLEQIFGRSRLIGR